MTGERRRKLRRAAAGFGFGVVVFAVALVFSFPYDRLKERIAAMAAAENVDLEIGRLGPTFGIGLAAADVLVGTRPLDGSKPTRFRIDSARVTLSPLPVLWGTQAVSASLAALGGEVDVSVRVSKQGSRQLGAEVRAVALADVPGVKEAINLPLAGTLDATLDVAAPGVKLAEAEGLLSWKCAGCALGDGKSKLKVASNPMLAEGLSLPRIRLGDFSGRVNIEKGVGRLQAVQARSPDIEIAIEGEIRLADPLPYSSLDLYVRFRPSEALLKNADKLRTLLQVIESMAKRPDGFFGFRVSGSLARTGPPQWMKTSPFGGAGSPAPAARATGASGGGAASAGRLVNPATDPSANLPRYGMAESVAAGTETTATAATLESTPPAPALPPPAPLPPPPSPLPVQAAPGLDAAPPPPPAPPPPAATEESPTPAAGATGAAPAAEPQ